MRRRYASLGLAIALVGCGGGSTGSDNVVVREPSVIAVNVVPDATAVDVQLDSRTVGNGLAYQGASSFAQVSAGDYDLSAGEAGTSISLWSVAQTLQAGQAIAAISLGQVNYGDDAEKRFQVVPVGIDRTVPNGSKSRLVFVNALLRSAGEETPSIDFQDGDRPQYPIANVAYSGSGTGLVDVGTYTFQARRDDSELVYAERSITFESGKIYLAILCGMEGQTGAKAPTILIVPIPSY